jgi:hypothetical protein
MELHCPREMVELFFAVAIYDVQDPICLHVLESLVFRPPFPFDLKCGMVVVASGPRGIGRLKLSK